MRREGRGDASGTRDTCAPGSHTQGGAGGQVPRTAATLWEGRQRGDGSVEAQGRGPPNCRHAGATAGNPSPTPATYRRMQRSSNAHSKQLVRVALPCPPGLQLAVLLSQVGSPPLHLRQLRHVLPAPCQLQQQRLQRRHAVAWGAG